MMGSYAVALVLVGSAVFFLWAARRQRDRAGRTLRLWRALRNARRTNFGNLPPGPVALRGKVVAIDLVVSPVTGDRGVYQAHTYEAWDESPNALGLGGRWICADRDEQAAFFELTDGNHAVLIDPRDSRVVVPRRRRDIGRSDMRISEAVLRPGEEVVVVGSARSEGGFEPSAGYRGHNLRTVVGQGKDGLLIAAPRGIQRRLLLSAGVSALGVLPVLGLLVTTVLYGANILPVMEVKMPVPPVACAAAVPMNHAAARARARAADARAVQRVGPVRVRAWVVGWVVGSAVDNRIYRRLRYDLSRRNLDGLVDVTREQRRLWLLFDEVTIRGTAVRR